MEINISQETLEFIAANRSNKTSEVALKLSKKPELPKDFILSQINGYQKASKKLPFLIDFPNYIFPDSRAVAQSSSEITANYKANLISGKNMLDASGGMGIDSYFFSKNVEQLTYLEPNRELFKLTCNNFKTLAANNIESHQQTAESFLEASTESFNWIYLDPDRRKAASRQFQIEDCSPNVLELLKLIWQHTSQVLIKLSPMLDISLALEQFPFCKVVIIISVENECKELLFMLEKDFSGEAEIKAVNIKGNKTHNLSFKFSEEQARAVKFNKPIAYLYEPNAAILKAGGFKSVADKFDMKKLAPNTHLYTSEKLITNFPGKIIKIEGVYKPKKGLVKKANVVCRNFPLKPEELKKKYKIADGGVEFLYACTLNNKERVFILGEMSFEGRG